MSDLLESTKALVDMARSGGVLTPLIPSAAVDCMEWCVKEIERLRRDYYLLRDSFTAIDSIVRAPDTINAILAHPRNSSD